MKRLMSTTCLVTVMASSFIAYVLLNKKTKKKADKLVNAMLDEATDMFEEM